jgi:hypothetical protein
MAPLSDQTIRLLLLCWIMVHLLSAVGVQP